MAKEKDKIDDNESLENIVAEADADVHKQGALDKLKSKRQVASVIDLAQTEKKQLIQVGILVLVLIIALVAANSISFSSTGTLRGSLVQANAAYGQLNNDIENFKASNPYYTGVDTSMKQEQNKEVNWIGTKLDAGRVNSDKAYFWTWISPAFDYSSAAEYNTNIAAFTAEKGLDKDNLFVSAFLKYYDYTSDMDFDKNSDGTLGNEEIKLANESYKCFTDKGLYDKWTRVIGRTQAGDYHYFSLVPMSTNANNRSYTMVAFTYTAKHNINPMTGSDSITIADFNVWPPDSQRLTLVQK